MTINISVTNISGFQKEPEPDVPQTLWDQRPSIPPLFALGVAILVLVVAYLPNLRVLVTVWSEDPNYSHGYLVIPITLFILWQQLSAPKPKTPPRAVLAPWLGWPFLVAVLFLRAVMYERGSSWLENSTIVLAVAALTWCFGSWPLVRRVWPAIAFLVFMLPLPNVVNQSLALPLQSLAASSSYFLLQLTGMWVIQEGNIIKLSTPHGMERLDVALACNGLRMLMTMAATVVATVVLLPLPMWKRITLLVSIVPIALVSNMARIVGTGWCYYLFQGPVAKQIAHDWAGWLMMPLAIALVGLELTVLSWLVPKETEEDEPIPVLEMTRRDSGRQKKTNQDLREV